MKSAVDPWSSLKNSTTNEVSNLLHPQITSRLKRMHGGLPQIHSKLAGEDNWVCVHKVAAAKAHNFSISQKAEQFIIAVNKINRMNLLAYDIGQQ